MPSEDHRPEDNRPTPAGPSPQDAASQGRTREGDSPESDAQEGGAQGSDTQETDTQETDTQETDTRESDTRETDTRETDTREIDTRQIRQDDTFPVVGIGASAGGVQAFSELMSYLPSDTGMAFVLVLHMKRDAQSQLSEIMSRETPMPVQQAEEGMTVEPNQVYAIPPGQSMTIADKRLHLAPRDIRSRIHKSIDIFFKSLATECCDKAIGVILSGSNEDGVRGVQEIKAAGGLIFVQSETSAERKTMPRAAIATGEADFTGTPQEIAEELVNASAHPYIRKPQPLKEISEPDNDGNLVQIFDLLRASTGLNLRAYKETTLRRRIFRRMALLKLEQLEDYVQYLNDHSEEVEKLYREILIGATSFFRDADLFGALKQDVLSRLFENRRPQDAFRVWVPGCSTGEEAYSIGICLLEYLQDETTKPPIQIFATDVNEAAIDFARLGVYGEGRTTDVSRERLRRFFVQEDGRYRVSKPLREMCVFAKQNLLADPPFSNMDLVSCRNVLIYFRPPAQRKILSAVHYSLKQSGILILGSSESTGSAANLFAPINPRLKLYAKQGKNSDWNFDLDPSFTDDDTDQSTTTDSRMNQRQDDGRSLSHEASLKRVTEQALLKYHNTAAVVVDEHCTVLQFLGQVGAYLSPTPGQASLDIMRLVRPELQIDLREGMEHAKDTQVTVSRRNISLQQSRGSDESLVIEQVNLVVIPLQVRLDESATYYLILFEQGPSPRANRPESRDTEGSDNVDATQVSAEAEQVIQRLQQELETTKVHLQSIIEEQEATNQDLRVANEEISSSNEELQSTNEELQTAKEEIQATNEELSTINQELYERNAETTRISNDFRNLLESINIPIIMVENGLCIRRFTPAAASLFNLIDSDRGRPLADIRHNLRIDDLEERIAQVIQSLEQHSEEVQDRDGYWYDLRVRPYRTMDNRIDGAVVVLVAIDNIKRSAEEFRTAQTYAEVIIQTVQDSLLVLNQDLEVVTATQYFYDYFQVSPPETRNRSIFSLGNGQWDIPELRSLLTELLPEDNVIEDFRVDHEFEHLGRRQMRLSARRIQKTGRPLILLRIVDITSEEEAPNAANGGNGSNGNDH